MPRAVNVEEHASLTVGKSSLEVVAVDGEEALSALFRFEVRCALKGDASAADPGALVGEEAVLTLRDGHGRERQITGLVAEAETRAHDDGSAIATLSIRPSVYPITLGRDCYVLHDVDVVDVIKDVLFEHRGPVRYDIARSYQYQKRDFCAQYREDDWTFLDRLLEEEGICYWFDHADGSALVFTDNTPSAPELTGGAAIPFHVETGMRTDDEVIEDIGRVVQVVSTQAEITSFNPEKPLFKVTAKVGDGPFEIYDAPGGGPNTPAMCEARARTIVEIEEARRLRVQGTATSIRLVPGMIFSLKGHPLSGLDGRYLVTRSSIAVRQRQRGGGERPLVCRFEAIPERVPYREPTDTPAGKQHGLELGVVVGQPGQEIFPDPLGRVRVQLHWDRLGTRDHRAGKWMRVAQRGAPGSMLLPRVGWNIATFNEEGAIDAPTVLSRIHDAEHPPAYSLPATKKRVVFRTPTTPGDGSANEIHFEDQRGAESMFLNASRDMNVLVLNESRQVIDNDQTRIIGNDRVLTVTDRLDENVAVNQTVTIGGSESITANAGKTTEVGGSETVTIGGNRTVQTGQGHSIDVVLDRTLKVGGSVNERTPAQISMNSKEAVIDVAGSLTRSAGGSISEEAGKGATQIISGAKTETATFDRTLKVDADFTETIEGSSIVDSGESFIDDADTTATWTIGATLSATGAEVWIKALREVRFRCGTSTVVLTPAAITIQGAKLDLSGATLDAVSGIIEHN
jgi:type VI secretion system secreted protein VgrG